MTNVRPLHQTPQAIAPGQLIATIQLTDMKTHEVFAWNQSAPYVIQVFDGWQDLMSCRQSDLVLPFGAINPVSGIPAMHNYIESVRRFQNRTQ